MARSRGLGDVYKRQNDICGILIYFSIAKLILGF
jgi:hypothetical protein